MVNQRENMQILQRDRFQLAGVYKPRTSLLRDNRLNQWASMLLKSHKIESSDAQACGMYTSLDVLKQYLLFIASI